jgi:hypothetical protein
MCRYEFPTPEVKDERELSESLGDTNTELSEEQIVDLNTPILDTNGIADGIADGIAIDAAIAVSTGDIAVNASNVNNIEAPNFETVFINLINSRNQNINTIPSIILPNMQMDTVRDGFSDNDIDEALRRSLED